MNDQTLDEVARQVLSRIQARARQQDERRKIGLLADDTMKNVLDGFVKNLSNEQSTRNKCATIRIEQDVALRFHGIDSRQPGSGGAFTFSGNARITRLSSGVYRIREEKPDRSIVVEKKPSSGWTFIEQEGFRGLSGRRAGSRAMGRGPDASIEI